MALLLCGSTNSLPTATLTALKHAVSASVHLAPIENLGQQHWQGIARVQVKRPGGKLLNSVRGHIAVLGVGMGSKSNLYSHKKVCNQ